MVFSIIRSGVNIPNLDKFLEWQQLNDFLKSMKINCVLDVGANLGQFAHHSRLIGYRGTIISFEPLHHEFELLSESFKHDRLWKGYNIALGDFSGITSINVIPHSSVMSSVLRPKYPPTDMRSQQIEVKRLDEILPSIISEIKNPRILLKLDTQGYDLKVFEGAKKCIDQINLLYSELSVKAIYNGMPDYLQALEVYENAGFELIGLTINSRTTDNEIEELNCLMRKY